MPSTMTSGATDPPSGTDTTTTDTTTTPTTTTDTTTAETDPPDDDSSDSSSSTTQGGASVCGDSVVEGDEVCDDGVNDGSYDGCDPDCSAFGPSCGDGELLEPEACDDGINDGSYDGCNADCTLAPFCGDGDLTGPEVCDDGINDGAYGGCATDCSALAEYCGDGQTTQDEVCDDGVNDGSYGGCNADCGGLAPFCGDEVINGVETCDDGGANADGAGCNTDCIVSGSLIGEFTQAGIPLFCEAPELTRPSVAPTGEVLVALTGCAGDAQVVLELDEDAVLSQDFSSVPFTSLPIFHTTHQDTDWLMSGFNCELRTSDPASVLEVCDGGRVYGVHGYGSLSDGEYFSLYQNTLVQYGPGSPAVGDTVDWTVNAPVSGSFDFSFNTAAAGQLGSVIVGGSRLNTSTGERSGYLTRRNSSNGSQANSRTISGISEIDELVPALDGTTLAIVNSPTYELRRLTTNLQDDWTRSLSANTDIHAAVDAAGDVVVFHRHTATGNYRLVKIREDGLVDRWTVEFPELTTTTNSEIAVDPTDNTIWLAYLTFSGGVGTLAVEHHAP